MPSTLLRLLLLGALCLAPFSSLRAATTPVEPLPAGLFSGEVFSADAATLLAEAQSVEPEEGAALQILVKELAVTFDSQGRRTYRLVSVSRLLRQTALDSMSSVEAQWQPWHQEKPQMRGRVVTAQGVEYWLDPTTIAELPANESNPDILSDRRMLRAPLPGVAVGCVIETELLIRDSEPFFSAGATYRFWVRHSVPTHRWRLTVEAPTSLPVQWRATLVEAQPEVATEGDLRRWVFDLGAQPADEAPEDDLPGDVPRFAAIYVSTAESWQTVATAYSQIVDRQIAEADLAEIVEQATAKLTDRGQRISALLAYLQGGIRYTGLEFGEAAIVPRPPGVVLDRGYGDCKDKAAFLVALLRAAEIPAHVALLNVGPGYDVDPDLPGLARFDHAIVHAPGDPEVWIDPTVEFARAGQLPPGDQDRWALIASPESRGLIRTPEPTSSENFQRIELTIELPQVGQGQIAATVTTHGAEEIDLRSVFHQINSAQRQELFDTIAQSSLAASVSTQYEVSSESDLKEPLVFSLTAEHSAFAGTELQQAATTIQFTSFLGNLPKTIVSPPPCEESEEANLGEAEATNHEKTTCNGDFATREGALVFSAPNTAEMVLRVTAPLGFELRQLPQDEHLRQGSTVLSVEAQEKSPREVTVTSRFDSGNYRLSAEEVDQLRLFIAEIRAREPLTIYFDHKAEQSIRAGRIKEALQELRAIDADASSTLNTTRIARAFIAAGLGPAARREARKAVELDPEDSIAAQVLGLTLIRDAVGRPYEAGMDRAGAIAAFQRAIELAPDIQGNYAKLTTVYELGADLVRFSPTAQLDEAVKVYKQAKERFDTTEYDQSILAALLYADRYDEAREFSAQIARATNVVTASRLAAISATLGADAAIREADKISDPAQRTDLLFSAANLFVDKRNYQLAANLAAAANRGSAFSAQRARLALVYGKAKRHEELQLDDFDPQSVAQRTLLSASVDRLASELPFASPRARASFQSFAETLSASLTANAKDELTSVDSLLDLLLAGLEVEIDGDARIGHRMRLSTIVTGTTPLATVYTVPNDGKPTLWWIASPEQTGGPSASSIESSSLGQRALALLTEGNLEGAIVWLNWAREDQEPASADDPFSGMPLTAFWPEESRISSLPPDELNEEQVRWAAVTIAAADPEDHEAFELLQDLHANPPASFTVEQRNAIETALIVAELAREDYENSLALLKKRLLEVPNSVSTWQLITELFLTSKNWPELASVAETRLANDPDNHNTLLLLSIARGNLQDTAGSCEALQRIVDSGTNDPTIYNNLAWCQVQLGHPDQETLTLALRAVQLLDSPEPSTYNTLATVYAELGSIAKAKQLAIEAIDLRGGGVLEYYDWYVFARIAQHLGEYDIAMDFFTKAIPPDDAEADSAASRRLAQRRLEEVRAALKEGANHTQP